MLEPVRPSSPTSPHLASSLDRFERSGSVWLIVLLSLVIVGVALSFSLFSQERNHPVILGLLALLAVIGIFSLFAGAAGLLDFAGRSRRFDLVRAVVDASTDAVLISTSAGRILYANAAYMQLAQADSLKDLRTLDRVYSGDPQVAEAVYRLNQAAGERRRLGEEVRVASPSGAMATWLHVRVQPVDQGGGDCLTAWIVSDITKDREKQDHVFLELQQVIDYLDHAPAGFLSVDTQGRLVYMNATLAGWLDLDLGEVSAGQLRIQDIVPAGQAELFTGFVAQAGAARTEVIDLDLMGADRQTRPVRALHRVSFASDGTPGPSRTLLLDRGSGSDTSENLRLAEVRFARFFNHTPMAIATVDREGRVMRTNALFAKLFPGHSGRGQSVQDVVAERDREQVIEALRLGAAGKGGISPVDVALAGQQTRSARFYVTAVEEQNGDGEAAIVYAMDTTEQRALETQYAQAQKMSAVGQLAGGIAHDFNNVLTAIIGFSDLLLSNHRPADPSFQDIMNIKQNANRAAGLVRQLLAFSRRQTLRPQVLELRETLLDMSTLLSRLLGDRVKLMLSPGRDLWPIKADQNQLEQVIVNLAVNGRDAMLDGGQLSIKAQNITAEQAKTYQYSGLPSADYVLIEVGDTGTGIPPEIIDKIFEPFFSTKEVGKGTGLGLSTVYGIVKQTGGYIYVDSLVGRGTVFRIFMPRHVPNAAELAKAAVVVEPKEPDDLTGIGTILLVEDEEAVRAFAARALTSCGYKVITADLPFVAIEMMKEMKDEISLIVSDVQMPEMDGPALVKELRAMKPSVKVVFMSGYAEEAFRRSVAENDPESGSFSFLPKPFALKQLAEVVKSVIGGGK